MNLFTMYIGRHVSATLLPYNQGRGLKTCIRKDIAQVLLSSPLCSQGVVVTGAMVHW